MIKIVCERCRKPLSLCSSSAFGDSICLRYNLCESCSDPAKIESLEKKVLELQSNLYIAESKLLNITKKMQKMIVRYAE